ncbi:hypothetical protein TIFTF001_039098 [Ficus carica]|uniref:Uncharacterized protein n=1 Tax=Ficus carica TaxID=3494 RepID=A0AA88JCH1_FICCA|nr:hypothetical protein TIFTF001_037782 [Ficus carica]GMN68735.1 hypothetical protein TIFTF001_037791 [Ficus carica]GMN70047.1 hypothetical protein TIFTF001_039090 [Ficus carica]GMN70052.1 hypothetical protein TIFTF001_039098 [Ficus carica]
MAGRTPSRHARPPPRAPAPPPATLIRDVDHPPVPLPKPPDSFDGLDPEKRIKDYFWLLV